MGVFACIVCGKPDAWNSHSPRGMLRPHDCPGPPTPPPGRGVEGEALKLPDGPHEHEHTSDLFRESRR